MEKVSSCTFCQHCGAEIHYGTDEACPGCKRDIDECVRVKGVTSTIYPM